MLDVRDLHSEDKHLLIEMLGLMYQTVPVHELASRYEAIVKTPWKCLGIFADGELLGIAGYIVNTRFYCGRYLYVDHFFVAEGHRSQNIGARLIGALNAVALSEGCEQMCLDTFVSNGRAQRFWFREGFQIVGFHFVKPLPLSSTGAKL